jgi:hypothetical protein
VWRRLISRFHGVLGLEGPPWRIALALAVGVFISCTPTFGIQTLLAVAVAAIFRLNRAATVMGVWVNLPWLSPFVYAGALKVGSLILPDREGIWAVSLAVLLGTTVVGLAAAALTYAVAFGALRWRRARHARPTIGPDETAPDVTAGPSRREPAA